MCQSNLTVVNFFAMQHHDSLWEMAGSKGEGVKVAMLDTGIDTNHRAFRDADLVVEDFCGGNPGVDVDGHGTQCCGIILQTAPACTLLVGRILVNSGDFSSDALFSGLMWARRNGADIICVCTGERIFDVDMNDLIRQIADEGRILVAAVGNHGRFGSGAGLFPARYPQALAVGSAEADGTLCAFTELPNDKEVVCLKGSRFLAPVPGGDYLDVTGTSMSAAFASGMIALKGKQNGPPMSIKKRVLDNCGFHQSERGAYWVLDPARFLNRVS
jgi:subtilisin family serine protease